MPSVLSCAERVRTARIQHVVLRTEHCHGDRGHALTNVEWEMADMPIGSPLPLHHVSHLREEWDGSGGLHVCKGVMDDGTAEG